MQRPRRLHSTHDELILGRAADFVTGAAKTALAAAGRKNTADAQTRAPRRSQ